MQSITTVMTLSSPETSQRILDSKCVENAPDVVKNLEIPPIYIFKCGIAKKKTDLMGAFLPNGLPCRPLVWHTFH